MFDLIASNTWIFLTLIVVINLLVGSFLNVVIHRLPIMLERNWKEECEEYMDVTSNDQVTVEIYNLAYPTSRCPACKTPIRFWQNIPVLSFIILRGKCAHCKHAISLRYLIVELLSCLLAVLLALQFGLSWTLFFVLFYVWILIAATFIDLAHQILPDLLTLSLLWLGLLASCFNLFASSHDAILGAIFGYGFFWIIATLFKVIRHKEGIGQGDFKLLAAIGAWVGWQLLPLVVLLSSVLALLIGGGSLLLSRKSHGTPIPFGPFIAIAGCIAIIWGFDLTQYYFHWLGIPSALNIYL